MWNDDHELEQYLSEFRPRTVRPPEFANAEQHTRSWFVRLSAAAGIVLAAAGSVWYVRRASTVARMDSHSQVPVEDRSQFSSNTVALTKLALDNQDQFEAQLANESRRVLPDFHGSHSALSVLAKD